MFTRHDYLDHRCTHREYYAQFVHEGIKASVRHFIGLARIQKALAEGDEHLNTIPLREWDALAGVVNTASVAAKLKECGDYLTLDGDVCILKEAATQLAEETTDAGA